jgi:hypothetical protein
VRFHHTYLLYLQIPRFIPVEEHGPGLRGDILHWPCGYMPVKSSSGVLLFAAPLAEVLAIFVGYKEVGGSNFPFVLSLNLPDFELEMVFLV